MSINKMKPAYKNTATAFDQIAGDYDITYGVQGNAVMTWMRTENVQLLKETFPPGSHLLELGCGSGEEAVALALANREILATDISPKMARVTRNKALAVKVGHRVRAVALPAGHIGSLHPHTPFDGAYASFGSLNCEPNLSEVSSGLARLLAPGALFVTSIMGPICFFEIIWFLLHGKPSQAFRRLRRGWQLAPVAGEAGVEISVSTRYLSAKEVAHVFSPSFKLVRFFALPLLLPPPYADNLFQRRRAFFQRIEIWERRLRTRWPWRGWGDHVVLILRRS